MVQDVTGIQNIYIGEEKANGQGDKLLPCSQEDHI